MDRNRENKLIFSVFDKNLLQNMNKRVIRLKKIPWWEILKSSHWQEQMCILKIISSVIDGSLYSCGERVELLSFRRGEDFIMYRLIKTNTNDMMTKFCIRT